MIDLLQSKRITDYIVANFPIAVPDFAKRIHVASETQLFRTGEDEGLWRQKKDEKYVFHIHFDGEFMCFAENEDPRIILGNFMESFKTAYKDKKIFINEKMYEIEDEKRKAIERAKQEELEKAHKKATTKEEKIVAEAVKRVISKKKKKQ
jgi:hypothetical protein